MWKPHNTSEASVAFRRPRQLSARGWSNCRIRSVYIGCGKLNLEGYCGPAVLVTEDKSNPPVIIGFLAEEDDNEERGHS